MAKKKRPVPLAPPPVMKSRKKARKVTSLFHKLTREIDEAVAQNETEKVSKLKEQLDEMGGREEYQRASQLSTKFHSTSRWVLKNLGKRGWSKGIRTRRIANNNSSGKESSSDSGDDNSSPVEPISPVSILEIGAINTELIDASKRTTRVPAKKEDGKDKQAYRDVPLYNINCRAIDLRSSHEEIEEQDFLKLPVEDPKRGTYHCLVCSMVLNCVTTAEDRGKMLTLLYQQLCPGGLCFFTIPKLCVNQSKYINRDLFEELLVDAIGFEIDDKKDTPKVSFWILKRPENGVECIVGSAQTNANASKSASNTDDDMHPWKKTWESTRIINRGKKFRNEFAVTVKCIDVWARRS
eukprot:CAMPEP_0204631046 /NCGR_PEP_ID=MMETSP0717-20131115/21904_1 /ASSEMBLY_ACC=CAM_ASM_000666 /TAXON_ID=230516 /ORGANISM="Chaetoceros curvisetus" /LENGTH=351 /DNA_ID=CAMNT_0051648511 /DNA_START=94 /DNA_END=1149 /DNA_ORIENTATION=+